MKIDWIKIKNEYINTNISYRKLAEKHKISQQSISRRGKKESWVLLKEKKLSENSAKVEQKTSEKIVNKEVNRIERILSTSDRLHNEIDKSIEQLTIYVDMFGKKHESDIVDVGRLKKLISALKELKEISDGSGSKDDISRLDSVLNKIDGVI